MSGEKYIGLDVHQATISVAVMDSQGKLIMESILETKASTILEFLAGLRGLADIGRPASFPQEPRRRMLSGLAAGTEKLRAERTADAYQQRRRSVSAHAAGARSAAHLGTVRCRL